MMTPATQRLVVDAAANSNVSWHHWVLQGVWMVLVFGWPVAVLLGWFACYWCCCGGCRWKRVKNSWVWDMIILYPILLAMLWYWQPSTLVTGLAWVWNALTVPVCTFVDWVNWAWDLVMDAVFFTINVYEFVVHWIYYVALLAETWVVNFIETQPQT